MKLHFIISLLYYLNIINIIYGRISATVDQTPVRYDDYKLYTVKVENTNQLNVLLKIEAQVDGYLLWELPVIGRDVGVLVSPDNYLNFMEIILRYNFTNELKIENFQSLIDNERPIVKPKAFGWTDYYSFEEIYDWLDTMLIQFPEDLTSFTIGNSSEERPIRGVKLSRNINNPAIFIESNIHAREWITSSTSTYFLYQLLTSNNPEIQEMSRNIDWYFIPILNVDGFVYSHTMNRLWRKTRQQTDLMCTGADANRNFDFQWMTAGASDFPCSDFFAGTSPFSEPETLALSTFFDEISSAVRIYIAFHSYGQYLALPYGHTTEESVTHQLQEAVGLATAEAIQQRYNTDYIVGSSAKIIYVTSGSSSDYIYNKYNHIPISYTIELRDRRGGLDGYVLPAAQILPNCEEIVDGMKALYNEARNQGVFDV